VTDAKTLIRETTSRAVEPRPTRAVPRRRLPIGAEPQREGGVHFRLWAPRCRKIAVEIEGLPAFALEPEGDGYFSGWLREARPGMRY